MKTMMGARRYALRAIERMRVAGCACGGLPPEEAGQCRPCSTARRLRNDVANAFPLGRKRQSKYDPVYEPPTTGDPT